MAKFKRSRKEAALCVHQLRQCKGFTTVIAYRSVYAMLCKIQQIVAFSFTQWSVGLITAGREYAMAVRSLSRGAACASMFSNGTLLRIYPGPSVGTGGEGGGRSPPELQDYAAWTQVESGFTLGQFYMQLFWC